MRFTPRYLLDYRRTYFSQNGEDGVLLHVLSRLPKRDKWCVEFGAWDGMYLSNTFFFIAKEGYKAVMIEADKERYNSLLEFKKKYGKIVCINRFISIDGNDTLDKILKDADVPTDFDLLSIDVDNDDYHLWKSIKHYQPKVVIIEIQPKDGPHIRRIKPLGSPPTQDIDKNGTSILSMTELAEQKGYSLVSHIAGNAIYVKNEFYNLYHDRKYDPIDFFTFECHDKHELGFRDKFRRRLEKLRIKKTDLLAKLEK